MQLNAITRKSALPAILLLVVILIATALRSHYTPFATELADCQYSVRSITLIEAMLLLLFGGIIEGKILPRSGLSKGYCTLPIPIFGVLACGVFVAPHILASATASLCFALALFLLLRSLHNAGEKDSVFFAAILLGAMVLLFPPSVVMVGIIPLSFFVLSLSLRQLLLMIVGYLLPLFGASYIMWYRGDEMLDLSRNIVEHLTTPQMAELTTTPYVVIAMTAVVAVVLIWGLIYALIRPDKMFSLARVRHALYLFILVFCLSLLMLLFPSCNLSVLAIMAVPTTILLSVVLSLLPNNPSTIAYWVLLTLFVLHLFVE